MEAIEVFNKTVGANLRKKRIEHGKSQQEIGDLLDVTFQQIQKYERGLNRISAGALMYLARHFNCPVSWFFNMPECGEALFQDSIKTRRSLFLVRALNNIEDLMVINKLEKLIYTLGKQVPIAN